MKIIKKIIISTLLITPIISISTISNACCWEESEIYSTGSEQSSIDLSMKCNEFKYKQIETNILEVQATFTFMPKTIYKLDLKGMNEKDFIFLYFNKEIIFTNKIKNTQLNGFDIFEQEIVKEKTTYIFTFDIKNSLLPRQEKLNSNKFFIWICLFDFYYWQFDYNL
ncbi:MAG: hypothetical protein K2H56_03555 [Malacoplasma sp.]|nr:hypothetical protein [Malacoplasma sp.]